MKTKITYYIFFIQLFFFAKISAQSNLLDDVTGKTIEWKMPINSIKNNKINSFREIELSIPIIKNESTLSENLKNQTKSIIQNEIFYEKLNLWFKHCLDIYAKDKESVWGEYLHKQITNQILTVDAIKLEPIFYYNGIIGLQLECVVPNAVSLSDNVREFKYCETVLYNTKTAKLSSITDYCANGQKTTLHKYLNNLYMDLVKSKSIYVNERDEQERLDYEKLKDEAQKITINISELYFDLNTSSIFFNSFSRPTLPFKGERFSLSFSADSIAKYIPFTKTKSPQQVFNKLNYAKINRSTEPLGSLSKNLFDFGQNQSSVTEIILNQFLKRKQTQRLQILYKNNLSGNTVNDTFYNLVASCSFIEGNLAEVIYGKDQGGAGKKYEYNSTKQLVALTEYDNSGKIYSQHLFKYANNLLSAYNRIENDGDQKDDENVSVTYSYNDYTMTECKMYGALKVSCQTYLFDSLFNLISLTEKGKKSPYQNVYVGSKKMATKSNHETNSSLYTYDNDLLDSYMYDAERYFVKYYYNDDKSLRVKQYYEFNNCTAKEEYLYDAENRLIQVVISKIQNGITYQTLFYLFEYK